MGAGLGDLQHANGAAGLPSALRRRARIRDEHTSVPLRARDVRVPSHDNVRVVWHRPQIQQVVDDHDPRTADTDPRKTSEVESWHGGIAVAEHCGNGSKRLEFVEQRRIRPNVSGVHDRRKRHLAAERLHHTRIEPAVRVRDEPNPRDAGAHRIHAA